MNKIGARAHMHLHYNIWTRRYSATALQYMYILKSMYEYIIGIPNMLWMI